MDNEEIIMCLEFLNDKMKKFEDSLSLLNETFSRVVEIEKSLLPMDKNFFSDMEIVEVKFPNGYQFKCYAPKNSIVKGDK